MKKLLPLIAVIMSVLFVNVSMSACGSKQSDSISEIKQETTEIRDSVQNEETNKESKTTEEVCFNVSYCDMDLRTKFYLEDKWFNEKITSYESWLKISQMLPNNVPIYNCDYFIQNSLIVCVGTSGQGGNKYQNAQLSFVDDSATVLINAQSGILCVITHWVLILEINGNKLENINKITAEINFQ